jgi:hypothetical protein
VWTVLGKDQKSPYFKGVLISGCTLLFRKALWYQKRCPHFVGCPYFTGFAVTGLKTITMPALISKQTSDDQSSTKMLGTESHACSK